MIIVKLTVLAVIVTAVYVFLYKSWLSQNPREAFKITFDKGYFPKSAIFLSLLVAIDIIGIFASAIYLLFFRQ